MSRPAAARLVAEAMRRTSFVLGPAPNGLEIRLFHLLMTKTLRSALDSCRQWAGMDGYPLGIWWMEAVRELEAELRESGDGWRWASDPPTTPRQVLATDGDGAYWVAVYDATENRSGMTEEELARDGWLLGGWVDAHSEEVLEVAAWREVPRWDGAEMPRRAGPYDGGFEGGRGDF